MRPQAKGIQWGVKVTCMHPECPKEVITWSDKGTPMMPVPGVRITGNCDGWIILDLRRYERRRLKHQIVYACYCPDHGGSAREWLNDQILWEKKRREVAAEEVSLKDQILAFCDPAAGRSVLEARLRKKMFAWDQANPGPKAPWKNY